MKTIAITLCLSIALLLTGCSSEGGIRRTPVGSFAYGSDTFQLEPNGTFQITHEASAESTKDYAIQGTYTFTLQHTDPDNRITFGKIDLTVTGLTLSGAAVQELDFTTNHGGVDVAVGDALLGWWKYMDLIPYGGKMNLGFNLPSTGYRPEDVNTGRDCLFLGDPVK